MLDLDASLVAQPALAALIVAGSGLRIDARDLGMRLRIFATRRAMAELGARLDERQSEGNGCPVIFYGSGDFHHLSTLFIQRARVPVTVIHFDNHPDWVRFPPTHNCGGWVNRALALPHVARVITIGPCSDDLSWPEYKTANLRAITSGRFEGLHEGQPIEIGSGDAVLFQLRCVADIFAESSACFGVALPASILAPLLRDPDGVCGTVLKVGTPLCRVLFDYIGSLVNNAAQLQIKDAAALAQSTAAMIAVCFGPAVDASRPRNANLRTASLMVIKRYIDENMNNSQLDAAHLTSIFGLSRASIYRMFEPLGGVAKFIQRNRLRRALIQLSSDEYIHLQVSEMSHNLGFASPTNFSRAFKAQFGMLPSEVRRNPQAAIAALSNSGESAGYDGAAEDGIDPLFAEWIHELG